jgi:signal transduction histidine kinase
MTDLLLETPLTLQQQDYITTIQHAGRHLMSIVNNILDFTKIESGSLTITNAPFNVRETIHEVLDICKHISSGYQTVASRAESGRFRLSYSVDDNVPTVLAGSFETIK